MGSLWMIIILWPTARFEELPVYAVTAIMILPQSSVFVSLLSLGYVAYYTFWLPSISWQVVFDFVAQVVTVKPG